MIWMYTHINTTHTHTLLESDSEEVHILLVFFEFTPITSGPEVRSNAS